MWHGGVHVVPGTGGFEGAETIAQAVVGLGERLPHALQEAGHGQRARLQARMIPSEGTSGQRFFS